MTATPTSRPILHAIAPRFFVGNAQQTLAFYERIGFASTLQQEGFMIVERDGVQLHLHPSDEPPTRHGAFWIRVSNIEALYPGVPGSQRGYFVSGPGEALGLQRISHLR